MRTPYVVALSIAAIGGANADDTYVERVGGAAKMIKGHPSIRMVREHVRIEPVSGKVVATFIFRNEGPKQTVLIGFPETHFKGSKPYKHFWSTVDSKPIGVTPIQGNFGEDAKGRYWTKRVSFEKGQTREVMVGYFGSKGEVSDGQRFMCYILESGAAWKGSIGQVRIDCDLSKLKYATGIKYSFEPDKITKKKATWNIRNWEPDQNLTINWYPGFRNFKSDGSVPIYRMYQGENYKLNVICPARVVGNDVYIAARCAAPVLGAGILKAKNGFILKNHSHEVRLTIGSRIAVADNKAIRMNQPVFADRGYAMIPFGQTMKLLGFRGGYDRAAKQFVINLPPGQ